MDRLNQAKWSIPGDPFGEGSQQPTNYGIVNAATEFLEEAYRIDGALDLSRHPSRFNDDLDMPNNSQNYFRWRLSELRENLQEIILRINHGYSRS